MNKDNRITFRMNDDLYNDIKTLSDKSMTETIREALEAYLKPLRDAKRLNDLESDKKSITIDSLLNKEVYGQAEYDWLNEHCYGNISRDALEEYLGIEDTSDKRTTISKYYAYEDTINNDENSSI